MQGAGSGPQGSGGTIRSYRDLVAWQRAIDLAEAAYRLTAAFPRDELYGLTSQTWRAAVSIAANIAEGYGRESRAAYVNFLRIARAALRELETHLIIAERVQLAEGSEVARLLATCDEQGRILYALITKVEASV